MFVSSLSSLAIPVTGENSSKNKVIVHRTNNKRSENRVGPYRRRHAKSDVKYIGVDFYV
jgi:hypothetical protein